MLEFIQSIPLVGGTLSVLLPFIIVLSIVVAIHEYGHYIVGRWCGIEADVFSVGFGPIIASRMDKRGTQWQLALIPLGGYVRFRGDTDAASTQGKENLAELPPTEAAKHFHTAGLLARSLTVAAGPMANFLLSAVVFTGLAFFIGTANLKPVVGEILGADEVEYGLQAGDLIKEIEGNPISTFRDIGTLDAKLPAKPILNYLVERDEAELSVTGPYIRPLRVAAFGSLSQAYKAGMEVGDVILSVDGQPVVSFPELLSVVQASADKTVPVVVRRAGQEMTLNITPRAQDFPNEDGTFSKRVLIGVQIGAAILPQSQPVGFFEAVKTGASATWAVISNSVWSIKLIVTGQLSATNLTGPVGIAQVSGQAADTGIVDLIQLVAFISTAIGFVNLLPIPVLDGGHLLSFAYEAVTRRKMNDRFWRMATVVGLALLMTLMVFTTFNDIVRSLS